MNIQLGSDLNFVEYVIDHILDIGHITFRKMFGEYTIYLDGKIVALVCDNQLFVKPTDAGRAFIGEVIEAAPYPGAKLCFLIEDKIEDRSWLSELLQVSAKELPEPKPKKKRKKRSS